jgi:ribosomal protein L12E/L44/L45/RPP1/RPP2
MTTQYTYAALLIHKEGQAINMERMNAVLKASGFEPDQTQVTDFVNRINGIDINYALKTAVAMTPKPVVTTAPSKSEMQVKVEEAQKNEDADLGVFKNLFG